MKLCREGTLGPDSSSAKSQTGGASSHPPAASGSAARFAFVDGLRGLAALGILVFHIWWYEPPPQRALESAHWMVDAALLRTRGAVQILLVVSGFVIAYTLRRTWFQPAEVQSFIARRLVRLIPAYWVTLGVLILVDALCRTGWGFPPPFEGDVSTARLVAHMIFLQDVAGHESLGAGLWTLCIEMQFYLVAILGWGLAQRLVRLPESDRPCPSAWGLLIVFAPLALASLLHWRRLDSTTPWVLHFLWMFFLGMTTWWTLDRALPLAAYAMAIAIGGMELVFDSEWRYENGVALATAIAVFAAGRRNRLHAWLNWAPLQFLGRISYSLYLIHFPVCHLISSAGWKWCGNSPTSLQACLILLAAIPASLAAGTALYLLVEAPSARWAARLKPATAAPGSPCAQ